MADEAKVLSLSGDAPRVRAMRSLREWMETGVLRPGEPLPPERVLAGKLGVGRATLQRALAVLESEGLLRFHGGHTRIVVDTRTVPVGMIRSAVALLSYYRNPSSHEIRSNWTEMTCRGALEEIRNQGRNALSFYLEQMTPDDVGKLAGDQPMGVVVPEASYPPRPIARELIDKLIECKVRFVVYGDWPQWAQFDRVASDHETGSYELTRWLVGQGCRRVLMLWPEPTDAWWAKARRVGHERALKEVGVPPVPLRKMLAPPTAGWDESSTPAERFIAQARYFAGYLHDYVDVGAADNEPIDAIMLPTDLWVPPVAAACRVLGLRPNEDILIASYDNYWQENPAQQFEPMGPAATVDKMNGDLGKAMVQLLAARAEGKLPEAPQCRKVTPKLIVTKERHRQVDSGQCCIMRDMAG
jgi:DNA-binding LacI/PurR family transcriptional regulator